MLWLQLRVKGNKDKEKQGNLKECSSGELDLNGEKLRKRERERNHELIFSSKTRQWVKTYYSSYHHVLDSQ